jgi:hypothetical protein
MKKQNISRISENHRRTISVRLSLLDEILCEYERIANGEENRGVMYEEENTLSNEQRIRLKQTISEIREIISQIKETLFLKPKKENLANKIWSSASSLWEVLVETESKYLKGYGEVPESLAEFLDPKVKEITRHLTSIVEIMRKTDAAKEF